MKWIGTRLDRRTFLSHTAGLTAAALLPGGQGTARAQGASQVTPVVATRAGRVRGRLVDGIHTFKTIPYAAPTGGANRFMPPQPAKPWTGVLDAFEYGHYAPQSNRPRGVKQMEFWSVLRVSTPLGPSEDCLNLNVWTKDLGAGAKKPVMVWFHGGGYDQGSGSRVGYDGAGLARNQDVVVVTVNHRLNSLGYLFLGDVGGPDFRAVANVGQLDLVASLAWVRDNISAFGGDPQRVMIFGQSGGGGKVSMLLGMPAAKGLFHAAAIESGSSLRAGDREAASKTAEKVLGLVGLKAGQGRELQRVPLDKLMEAGNQVSLGPVMDGKVLPAHPFDPVATPLSADIPVIIGWARTERTVYEVDDPSYGKLDQAGLMERVTRVLGDAAGDVIANYRKRAPRATPYELAMDITTDAAAMNAIHQAERHAALGKAATYMYVFAWETPVMHLRAPHTIEIPFVFNHIDATESMVGPVKPEMKRLEGQSAGAWAALARSGNPNHPGLPEWPAYDGARRPVMIFDARTRVDNDPTGQVRRIMENRPAGGTR